AAAGHQVVVIAPRMAGAASAPGVVRVPAVPAPTYPDFALPLPLTPGWARRIAALDLDGFHAQHPFLLGRAARPPARPLRRRRARPLVFPSTPPDDNYPPHAPLPPRLAARQALAWTTRYANQAALVTAPSAALAARLRAQGVRRPTVVLPTGVDRARFHPGDQAAAPTAPGLPAGPPCLYPGPPDPSP